MNAVIGLAQLLESGVVKPESPKFKPYLGQIVASGRQLLQLIDSMLDYSKAESKQIAFRPEPVDLAHAIQEVIDMLAVTCGKRHVTITAAVSPEIGEISTDPLRLRQVLLNLVGNAVKFSHDAGVVALRAQAEGTAHWRIDVEDHGIGIAAADLPKLFTRFHQLSSGNTKSHEGTGIGLALVRRMLEAQGGAVGVRSTLGSGSVFHLILPRVAPVPPA